MAKQDLRHSIVCVEVVDAIGNTATHSECASLKTSAYSFLQNRHAHVARLEWAIPMDARVLHVAH